jgi:hypothetical protein
MQQILVHLYNPRQYDPEIKIAFPLSTLEASIRILPAKVQEYLRREGIDLSVLCGKLGKEFTSGKLIEIERPDGRLIISSQRSFSVKAPIRK